MHNNVRRITRCSFFIMLTFVVLLAFFSCDSLFSGNYNEDNGEVVAFTGTVSLSPQLYEGGAVPEQYVAEFSRLALAEAVVENNADFGIAFDYLEVDIDYFDIALDYFDIDHNYFVDWLLN